MLTLSSYDTIWAYDTVLIFLIILFLFSRLIYLLFAYTAYLQYFGCIRKKKICFCGVPFNNSQPATDPKFNSWSRGQQCSTKPAATIGQFAPSQTIQPGNSVSSHKLTNVQNSAGAPTWPTNPTHASNANATNNEEIEQRSTL